MTRDSEADINGFGHGNRRGADESPCGSICGAISGESVVRPYKPYPVGEGNGATGCIGTAAATDAAPLQSGLVCGRQEHHGVLRVSSHAFADHQPGLGPRVRVLHRQHAAEDFQVALCREIHEMEFIGRVPDIFAGALNDEATAVIGGGTARGGDCADVGLLPIGGRDNDLSENRKAEENEDKGFHCDSFQVEGNHPCALVALLTYQLKVANQLPRTIGGKTLGCYGLWTTTNLIRPWSLLPVATRPYTNSFADQQRYFELRAATP